MISNAGDDALLASLEKRVFGSRVLSTKDILEGTSSEPTGDGMSVRTGTPDCEKLTLSAICLATFMVSWNILTCCSRLERRWASSMFSLSVRDNLLLSSLLSTSRAALAFSSASYSNRFRSREVCAAWRFLITRSILRCSFSGSVLARLLYEVSYMIFFNNI